jgi:hypothetical protein
MDKIKELLLSDNYVNHQLALMLAFGQYGKSFDTFLEVIKCCYKVNKVSHLVDDLVVLYIENNFAVNIWRTTNNHKLYIFLYKDFYELDMVSQIKASDITDNIEKNRFTIFNHISSNIDYDDVRIKTYLKRVYKYLIKEELI